MRNYNEENLILYLGLMKKTDPSYFEALKDRTKRERGYGKMLRINGLQILRFEVRYNGQQTVTAKLKHHINKTPGPVLFSMLFNQEIWQNVLINEWQAIVGPSGAKLATKLFLEPKEIVRLLSNALITRKRNVYGMKDTLAYYGLFRAIHEIGVNPLKSMFEQQFSDKTVHTRLDKQIAEVQKITKDIPSHPAIAYIDNAIKTCAQISAYVLEENGIY